MDQHVKKIVTSLCWLRPVTSEVPILRVQGVIEMGEEHISTYGPFVRWQGKFMAIIVCKPDAEDLEKAPLGMQRNVTSYNLIVPKVAEEWLASYFVQQRADAQVTGRDSGDTRTGRRFIPAQALDNIRFVLDLGLIPSKQRSLPGSGGDSKGYEFTMRICRADPRYNPMEGLLDDVGTLPAFAPKVLASEPREDEE